jgi:hypothetical protein
MCLRLRGVESYFACHCEDFALAFLDTAAAGDSGFAVDVKRDGFVVSERDDVFLRAKRL